MTLEPVTAAVKVVRSSLARDLNLRAGVPSEFRALARRRHFELGNRIHADAICKLLVYAGVCHRLPIDSEVVLIRTLAVECRTARYCVRWSAWNCLQQSCEIAAVQSDVQ